MLKLFALVSLLAACGDNEMPELESGRCDQYTQWMTRDEAPYITRSSTNRIEVDYAPFQPLKGSAFELDNPQGRPIGMLITQPLELHWTDGTTHTGTVLDVDGEMCMWSERIN